MVEILVGISYILIHYVSQSVTGLGKGRTGHGLGTGTCTNRTEHGLGTVTDETEHGLDTN